jgi:hypothetical protein
MRVRLLNTLGRTDSAHQTTPNQSRTALSFTCAAQYDQVNETHYCDEARTLFLNVARFIAEADGGLSPAAKAELNRYEALLLPAEQLAILDEKATTYLTTQRRQSAADLSSRLTLIALRSTILEYHWACYHLQTTKPDGLMALDAIRWAAWWWCFK